AILDDRGEQVVLRREAPEDRADTDAGALCHLGDAGVDAALREYRARGLEDEAAVALGIRTERCHAAIGIASSVLIEATSRLRRRVASTAIAPTSSTAPIRNARWYPESVATLLAA